MMPKLLFAGALCCGLSAAAANTALIPTPRDFPTNWIAQHQANVAAARRGGIDILFLGDSITAGWNWGNGGDPLWKKYYAPRHAANFGIGWDRIQNVCWRIENGELDGLSPRVVILLIGTNNCGNENDGHPRNSTPEIIAGVSNLVQEVRFRLPKSQIILFGLFPRGETNDPVRLQVHDVNCGLAQLAGTHVHYLDIGKKFLEPDGTLSRSLFPDLLHPNTRGYQIWADALNPELDALLK